MFRSRPRATKASEPPMEASTSKGEAKSPYDARMIRQMFGFDPDDDTVHVSFIPLDGTSDLADIHATLGEAGYFKGGGKGFVPDIGFDRDFVTAGGNGSGQVSDAILNTARPESPAERMARLGPAVEAVVAEVTAALWQAVEKHAPMNSPHEGYGVILEELDELWDEIKLDGGGRDRRARKEARQVAAMGMRYLLDIDPR